jgi:hypothetical protein
MPTDGADERPLGRPTKFNDETIGRLCTALSDGMPIKGACVVAGIGVTTLAEWRASQPDLEERMSEARERARQKALQAIKGAGEKDWRTHAEWLRLSFPADYRGSANKIEVSASANAATVIITEERQRELQERRAKALEATAGSPQPGDGQQSCPGWPATVKGADAVSLR